MSFEELFSLFSQFFFMGECTLYYYMRAKKISKGYYLKREAPIVNIDNVMIAPEVKQNVISEKKRIDEEFSKEIESFIIKLKGICNEDNLNIFYKNMCSIKIKQKFDNPFSKHKVVKTVGAYNPKSNKIKLIDKDGKEKTLHHELFHAASTVFRDGLVFSGFDQQSKSGTIGVGLNEGYTELLASRNFKECIQSYLLEGEFAKIVEKIIGEDRMLELYLTANLKDLITELSFNTSNDFVLAIISSLDYICRKKIIKEKEIIEYNERVKFVFNSLVFIRMKQLEVLFQEDKIDKAEYRKELFEYIRKAKYIVFFCRGKVDMSNDLLDEKYEELLSGRKYGWRG